MKNDFNLKNIVKNNLLISIGSILIVVFFVGYFVGVEAGEDSARQQELEKYEKRIAESKTPKIETFSEISKDDDPILGDPDAPISIIEFSDYQCQFCARFYSDTLPLLNSQYIETGKVNLISRDFPIVKIHSNAMPTALASECANEQGKFWEYHGELFETQNTWKQNKSDEIILTLKQFAKDLNLNQEQFDACLDSKKYAEEISNDLADGQKYFVTGTPTFFVGNDKIGYSSIFGAQSFSDFRIMIDEKLSQ